MTSQSYIFNGNCLSNVLKSPIVFFNDMYDSRWLFSAVQFMNILKVYIISIQMHEEFFSRLGKNLITKAIAWQWLFVVYPHFNLRAKQF